MVPDSFDQPRKNSTSAWRIAMPRHSRALIAAWTLVFCVLLAPGPAPAAPTLTWYDVRDFGSIQEAIDRAAPGAVIYIPSGIYNENIVIDKQLTIQGDQIGANPFIATDHAGTVIQPTSRDSHAITIRAPASLVQIKDLRIQGADRPGDGDGIHIVGDRPVNKVSTVTIENVFITAVGRHGVYCHDVDFPYLNNVHSVGNKHSGFWFETSAQVLCVHTYALENDLTGVRVDAVGGFQWHGIGIERNQTRGRNPDIDAQLFVTSSSAIIIGRTDFETFDRPGGANTAMAFRSCTGVNILGNAINNAEIGGRGILIDGNNKGVFIGSNQFVNVDTAIKITHESDREDGTVSSDILIANQGYRKGINARIVLPPMEQRSGKGIVVMGDQGILPPSFSQASRPAPSGALADGNAGMLIYVPDARTNAARIQFSDGEHWRDLNGQRVP
jgi:hypothetical protein